MKSIINKRQNRLVKWNGLSNENINQYTNKYQDSLNNALNIVQKNETTNHEINH